MLEAHVGRTNFPNFYTLSYIVITIQNCGKGNYGQFLDEGRIRRLKTSGDYIANPVRIFPLYIVCFDVGKQ